MAVGPYEPRNELRLMLGPLSKLTPPLKAHHLEVLEELEIKKSHAFNQNKTAFIVKEVFRYQKERKVFRSASMGETRGGKSEGEMLLSLIQVFFFNHLFRRGHFAGVDVSIKKRLVELTVDEIHGKKTDYLNYVRQRYRDGSLVYGTVNIIDEEVESEGGLGSMTEIAEIRNYNNIVAKYNLGEHWIYPKRFMDMNASYGINWFIKDVKNRVNWGLLYRMENWSRGISSQSFLGWVCFPLHENHALREAYERKKNAWIDETIAGGGDPRAKLRLEAARVVAEHPLFGEMRTEKSFLLTNNQQLDIIDGLIQAGKLQGFNAQERERIADSARLIVKEKRAFGTTNKTLNEQKPAKNLKARATR